MRDAIVVGAGGGGAVVAKELAAAIRYVAAGWPLALASK